MRKRVAPGQIICPFAGVVKRALTPAEVATNDCVRLPDGRFIVPHSEGPGSSGRCANHDCEPNASFDVRERREGEFFVFIVARTALYRDNVVTVDYGWTVEEWAAAVPSACACGRISCRFTAAKLAPYVAARKAALVAAAAARAAGGQRRRAADA